MSISTTIPASAFVNVNPGVISPGGAAVNLNGLFLTENTRVPIGSVLSFPSPASVSAYFGPSTNEVTQANVYFSGFTISNVKPGALLFAQYPASAVAAYLRGGNISSLSLTALQAISGSLDVTIDGYPRAASSVNLSAATSFSSAAGIIQTALSASEPTEATCTSGTISGTTLTVAGTITGAFAVGQTITGTSVTAGSVITALGTGTGGAGTYILSASSTVVSGETITASATPLTVTYDSVSGAFVITSGITGTPSSAAFATGTISATLLLTSATGAVLSQGSAPATPSAFMSSVTAITNNFATFTTLFNPDVSGNSNKVAFALWTTQQNNSFAYIAWDTDITPTESTDAASSLGQILIAGEYSGTCPIYEPTDLSLAAMVCGFVASVDYTQRNGNTSFGYKSQGGIQPSITNILQKSNLQANGYNFYCEAATGNSSWIFFYPGTISGPFLTLQRYANQMWLNRSFQISLMDLLTNVKAVPYVQAGYALIEAAMQNDIQQALTFGMIQPGVILSPSEMAEVNYAAGANIAGTLQTAGYYVQVLDPGAIVRGGSGSPSISFWYTDGGSVLQLNVSSTDVI